VGTSAEELESINKLIKIENDHIYYKPAVPIIVNTSNSEPEVIVEDSIEIVQEEDLIPTPSEDTVVQTSQESDTYVICDSFSNQSQDILADVPNISSDPRNIVDDVSSLISSSKEFIDNISSYDTQDFLDDVKGLGDETIDFTSDLISSDFVDCVSPGAHSPIDELLFNHFNWEKMSWDLDALSSVAHSALEASVDSNDPSSEAIQSSTPISKNFIEPAKVNSVNVIATSSVAPPQDCNIVFDEVSQALDQPVIKTESGYGSDLSDAGSPMGSTASFDDLFEDSLSELFPSLL